MVINEREQLTGDAAKLILEHDEFGLKEFVQSLSSVLQERISARTYVIGIEGEWGSGKTSLINFVAERLSQEKLLHKFIRFDPWLVGSKRSLLRAFFPHLSNAIRELGSDPLVRRKLAANPSAINKALKDIARYADALEGAGTFFDSAAEFDPTGKSKPAAWILKVLSFLAKLLAPKNLTLEELRDEIKGDLQTLVNLTPGLRFTIAIDDLDRLDPSESVELLRLIKNVADFPGVTYLVCFDRATLVGHVESVLQVPDGHAYIEKIFQTLISLPPQEPFALRRFARKLLTEAFPEEMQIKTPSDRAMLEREQVFFDDWVGKFVSTPRDAIRLCEAIKLGWPFIRSKADFIDYAWLQLLKLQCHPLHSWVREYVVNFGSYRDAGRPGDEEPERDARRLTEILRSVGWPTDFDRKGMGEFLPGLAGFTDEEKPAVYSLDDGALEKFESAKRLGSPSHWRYYFSFAPPSYAIDDDDLGRFMRAIVDSPSEAVGLLRSLLGKPHHSHRGYYFDVLLERLFDKRKSLTADEQIGIAKTLSQVMDEVVQPPGAHFGLGSSWDRATSLLGPPVAPYLQKLIETSPSINWLANVIRDQGFAFGLPDQGHARPERAWVSREEFDGSLSALLTRFRDLGIEGVVKKPEPLTILYCWKQLGDEIELRTWITDAIKDEGFFLEFLEAIRTWVSSSNKGLYRPLSKEIVGHFLEVSQTVQRLERMASRDNPAVETRVKASELLAAFKEPY